VPVPSQDKVGWFMVVAGRASGVKIGDDGGRSLIGTDGVTLSQMFGSVNEWMGAGTHQFNIWSNLAFLSHCDQDDICHCTSQHGSVLHAKCGHHLWKRWVQEPWKFKIWSKFWVFLWWHHVPMKLTFGMNRAHHTVTLMSLILAVIAEGNGTRAATIQNLVTFVFFTRATVASSAICCRCLSVCPSFHLSVTSRCSTKMAKRRITQTMPHDSPEILVFWRRKSRQNSHLVTPREVLNAGGVG